VGHSEPRKIPCESDEQINLRARNAQAAGPVSDRLLWRNRPSEKQRNRAGDFAARWSKAWRISMPHPSVVAYEPIGSIGTGKTCGGRGANASAA